MIQELYRCIVCNADFPNADALASHSCPFTLRKQIAREIALGRSGCQHDEVTAQRILEIVERLR